MYFYLFENKLFQHEVEGVYCFYIGSSILRTFVWQLIYERGYELKDDMYYYPVNPALQGTYNATARQFALCESCFWSATIIKPKDNSIHGSGSCPVCSIGYVSLIPLTIDEVYELKIRPKGGMEMSFSKANL